MQAVGGEGLVDLVAQDRALAEVAVGLGEVDVARAARRDEGVGAVALRLGEREVAADQGVAAQAG